VPQPVVFEGFILDSRPCAGHAQPRDTEDANNIRHRLYLGGEIEYGGEPVELRELA